MDLDFKHRETHGSSQCTWCETPLSWINHEKNSVCSHCYELLANSGVAEEEITRETDLLARNASEA
ncbi:MAG: hypothetical protein ABL959_18955 [Pyrinomonadaceae bacterium]